ncbi:retrovirus-related pol polyprotein from transposon TNT 1-94 [Tanacetum coccineum]
MTTLVLLWVMEIMSLVIVKHSCYVRDTDGVELLKGSYGSNLYTISVEDMIESSPICLLSKASKHKSWLWHWRLNHLNFDIINDLARKDLVWICQILQEISQKRTRERMSDQEAKEIKAEAREIMPQPSTVNCS